MKMYIAVVLEKDGTEKIIKNTNYDALMQGLEKYFKDFFTIIVEWDYDQWVAGGYKVFK
jgi:hypothetical protein